MFRMIGKFTFTFVMASSHLIVVLNEVTPPNSARSCYLCIPNYTSSLCQASELVCRNFAMWLVLYPPCVDPLVQTQIRIYYGRNVFIGAFFFRPLSFSMLCFLKDDIYYFVRIKRPHFAYKTNKTVVFKDLILYRPCILLSIQKYS